MNEHDELIELIISRTKEMANILYGSDPIGECDETYFDIKGNGCLLVRFEEYCCGYSDIDSYYLPLEFLFSEDYRNNYKTMILQEKIRKEEEKLDKKRIKDEKDRKQMEDYDKSEYERLKIKGS